MMRRFSKLLVLCLLFLSGCDSKIDTSAKDVKLDRDVCERCKMVISDKDYNAQVVNPKDGKRYFFDDIGCALLWIDEQKIEWASVAVIYVADADTTKWIDAKAAFYTDGANSPMRFGFAAHAKVPEGEHRSFSQVVKSVLEIKEERMKARMAGTSDTMQGHMHDDQSMPHHHH